MSQTEQGDLQELRWKGDLNAASAPELRRQLEALLEKGSNRLLLDLEGVGFVDSSGLSALIGVLKAARAEGGNLALVHVQPQVRSILQLTRLDRVFDCFDDAAAAAKALGGSS
ncbi:MAG: STAS domain-containing protein [Thermoanaerobaculia bacterium]|nr:STAS domain-containing protein [Thermoanaerobaculia bacterium]